MMRTPFYLICICLLLVSCKKDQKETEIAPDEYVIEGSAKGLVNGLRAYLKGTNEKGFLKDRDTAIIMNERFVFQGKIDTIRAWHLEINSLDGSFPFVIDNASLNIDVDASDIKKSKISGTVMNDAIDDYNSAFFGLQDSIAKISDLYRKRLVEKSDVRGMSDQIKALKDQLDDLPFNFIKDHPENPYGLVLLNYMIRRNTGDKGKIVNAYDQLPESLVNSNLGRRISKNIPNIRKQYEIIAGAIDQPSSILLNTRNTKSACNATKIISIVKSKARSLLDLG